MRKVFHLKARFNENSELRTVEMEIKNMFKRQMQLDLRFMENSERNY